MLTGPYRVITTEPSTIGRRSRWTPSRGDIRAVFGVRRNGLVDLVEKDDAGVLGPLNCFVDDGIEIDQAVRFLLGQNRAASRTETRRRIAGAARDCLDVLEVS